MYKQIVSIDNKNYTLTTNRALFKTLYSICPEFFVAISDVNKQDKTEPSIYLNIAILSNLDIVFYEMIKREHPELTKEDSDALLLKFETEYDDASSHLMKFVIKVFTQGNPDSPKKKLDWQ